MKNMPCNKIKELLSSGPIESLKEELRTMLLDHLDNCPDCASDQQLRAEVHTLLASANELEKEASIPMNAMRTRVETTIASKQTPKLIPIGITGAVAAVMLVVVIWFSNSGNQMFAAEYEVAIEGVDQSLIDSNGLICEMLEGNGLIEAGYDVTGCEATCNLVVFNLRTKDEAELVVRLFGKLSDENISSRVIPITPPAI